MIEINNIEGQADKIQYMDEVITLSMEARQYLASHRWCKKVVNGWLVKDWGYMLCIFYFEIEPAKDSGADNYVWIVVGDIPPAYIDIESATNELEVIEMYVSLMSEWIENTRQGKSTDDCFPIGVNQN